ncbi:MAG: zinc-binding dehydrogenase [Candidatus Aminicenantes bacterium]|nr:zinc-binding dehydrogenase [Candidatus Aminicenantes bacterium]
MKAAVLTGPGRVEIREVPKPAVQSPDDVLLRTAVAGLCGSDLHYFTNEKVGSEAVTYPAVVGHECSAVVEGVGPEVRKVKPGDRVAVEPSISCGTCDRCLAGRENICRRIRFLGHPGERDGCLAEYFVMPEKCCFPVPAEMSMAEAMLAEPLSIALHALQLAGGAPAREIAVLGSGPIGLSIVLAAKAAGAAEVLATDIVEARVEAARRAGAVWSGNASTTDVARAILDLKPLGLDAVYECSGAPEAIAQAVEVVKPGGRIYQVGIPMAETITYPAAKLRRREISIQHVRRQNRCLERAIALIGMKVVRIAWLASHAFKLADTEKAFAMAAGRTDGILKAAIVFDRRADGDPTDRTLQA